MFKYMHEVIFLSGIPAALEIYEIDLEVKVLANIKSAKKRIKITAKKTLRNRIIKTKTKNSIKKVISASAANDKDTAQVALVGAVKTIDKAVSKGVFHKNNGSRKKSRLAKLVNKIGA